MPSFPLPIERLLPQRPPMLLLDRLLSCTASEGTADARISAGNLFRLPDDTIHEAALFELMAQAYAAVRGFQDSLAGKPASIGYLAGITRAVVHGAARVGDRLTVSVRQTALLQPFVRAEARVVRDGDLLAEGELTLFVPPAGDAPS
jgi:predicted hotdog family 3-hydroxylacyl-ACP dehydratase